MQNMEDEQYEKKHNRSWKSEKGNKTAMIGLTATDRIMVSGVWWCLSNQMELLGPRSTCRANFKKLEGMVSIA